MPVLAELFCPKVSGAVVGRAFGAPTRSEPDATWLNPHELPVELTTQMFGSVLKTVPPAASATVLFMIPVPAAPRRNNTKLPPVTMLLTSLRVPIDSDVPPSTRKDCRPVPTRVIGPFQALVP